MTLPGQLTSTYICWRCYTEPFDIYDTYLVAFNDSKDTSRDQNFETFGKKLEILSLLRLRCQFAISGTSVMRHFVRTTLPVKTVQVDLCMFQ